MENKIEDILNQEKEFIFPIRGISMLPLLREKKDCVILSKCLVNDLKKYDIVLYRYKEKYLLHRILKINNNNYIIRGDNTYAKEYVTSDQIIGKANFIYRKENKINPYTRSRIFLFKLWNFTYPIRFLYKGLKAILKRLFLWKKSK